MWHKMLSMCLAYVRSCVQSLALLDCPMSLVAARCTAQVLTIEIEPHYWNYSLKTIPIPMSSTVSNI